MGERIRKLKKIRIHHEGTSTLITSILGIAIAAFAPSMIKRNAIE